MLKSRVFAVGSVLVQGRVGKNPILIPMHGTHVVHKNQHRLGRLPKNGPDVFLVSPTHSIRKLKNRWIFREELCRASTVGHQAHHIEVSKFTDPRFSGTSWKRACSSSFKKAIASLIRRSCSFRPTMCRTTKKVSKTLSSQGKGPQCGTLLVYFGQAQTPCSSSEVQNAHGHVAHL